MLWSQTIGAGECAPAQTHFGVPEDVLHLRYRWQELGEQDRRVTSTRIRLRDTAAVSSVQIFGGRLLNGSSLCSIGFDKTDYRFIGFETDYSIR